MLPWSPLFWAGPPLGEKTCSPQLRGEGEDYGGAHEGSEEGPGQRVGLPDLGTSGTCVKCLLVSSAPFTQGQYSALEARWPAGGMGSHRKRGTELGFQPRPFSACTCPCHTATLGTKRVCAHVHACAHT